VVRGRGRGVLALIVDSICVCVFPCVFMSPATAPPHFYTWGGKPYPYVLILKGKPLGRNPNMVNPKSKCE